MGTEKHDARALASAQIPVEIIGAGTKRGVGRPLSDLARHQHGDRLRGITLYEPTELVMSARAGTPLSQIEVELASRGQMLAFEPIDLGPVLGAQRRHADHRRRVRRPTSPARAASPRARARDHLLGVRAVNGRGEIFKSGGRVMKNVTGYRRGARPDRKLGHAGRADRK